MAAYTFWHSVVISSADARVDGPTKEETLVATRRRRLVMLFETFAVESSSSSQFARLQKALGENEMVPKEEDSSLL